MTKQEALAAHPAQPAGEACFQQVESARIERIEVNGFFSGTVSA